MIDLNTIWFVLLGVLIAGYAILDGFDLGAGILSLFARGPQERRIYMNAIGPVWDGNEVWLLTAGGALFAAFPVAYATVFSAFYIPFMVLLAALIFRAVSIEFRGKVESGAWRRFWDAAFGFGSLVPAVLFGVAFGNILRGLPLDEAGRLIGPVWVLLNPFAVLVGLLSLAMFVMHGAVYMALKTDGELQDRMRRWGIGTWVVFAVLYGIATVYAMFDARFLFIAVARNPMFYPLLFCLCVGVWYVPVGLSARRFGRAFMATSLTIAGMIGLSGISLYPYLVVSRWNFLGSLTIHSACSTHRTLEAMLIIALIGMPVVLVYTAFVYWVFRGKVGEFSDDY